MPTFKYFAFGSNLLRERILIKNPTAVFCCRGTLSGYKLGFAYPRDMPEEENGWEGCGATIYAAQPENYVIGCVWDIDMADLPQLDEQESHYNALQVDVKTDNGEMVSCRTYQMTKEKEKADNLPNPYYLKVIIDGARQQGLPDDYVAFLESFPTNERKDPPPMYQTVLDKVEQFRKLHASK